jgi:hypothetical protein
VLNRARRARLSAIRCQDKARRAAARGLTQVAEEYRNVAADWLQVLRDLDAPITAACEECGVAEGEDCADECGCDLCEVNRALDDDADAQADR